MSGLKIYLMGYLRNRCTNKASQHHVFHALSGLFEASHLKDYITIRILLATAKGDFVLKANIEDI